jgi:hypothetical protein
VTENEISLLMPRRIEIERASPVVGGDEEEQNSAEAVSRSAGVAVIALASPVAVPDRSVSYNRN